MVYFVDKFCTLSLLRVYDFIYTRISIVLNASIGFITSVILTERIYIKLISNMVRSLQTLLSVQFNHYHRHKFYETGYNYTLPRVRNFEKY